MADQLRRLADQVRYDLRRADQFHALADGFERFANRLQEEARAGN